MKILVIALVFILISISIYSTYNFINSSREIKKLSNKINILEEKSKLFDKKKEDVLRKHNEELSNVNLMLENQLMITSISKNEVVDTRKSLRESERKLRELEENTVNKDLYKYIISQVGKTMANIEPKDLMKMKDSFEKESKDITGVYIIENKSKEEFYVGRSLSAYREAVSHFTGEGNPSICSDYSNGDKMFVKIASIKDSDFNSLLDMEDYYLNLHRAINI